MEKNATSLPAAGDLEALRLPDLQARFAEVLGEPTRCPNRRYLIRRITESLAGAIDAGQEPADRLEPAATTVADQLFALRTATLRQQIAARGGRAEAADPEPAGAPEAAPGIVVEVGSAEPVNAHPMPAAELDGAAGTTAVAPTEKVAIGDVAPGTLVRSVGGTVVRVVGPARKGFVSVAHLRGTGRESVSGKGVPAAAMVAILAGAELEVEEARRRRQAEQDDGGHAATPAPKAPAKARKGDADTAPRPRDPRLPAVGSVIRKEHKGEVHEIACLEDGFEWRGQRFKSLSGVTKAITRQVWNGYLWAFGAAGWVPPAKRGVAPERPAA